MFITKHALSRRTVLRGMGAAVALPLLDAMVPAIATARELAPVLPKSRFTGIEMVHGSAGATEFGTQNHLWSPAQVGRDFEFTKTLQPLEPFRDYLTVVSHTDCSAADPVSAEEVGADHFRSSAVFLTAAHAKQTEGSDIRNGTSIDQMYARGPRPGHAAAVDPAVHREPRFIGHLRVQLQLRLHGHDQLGRSRPRPCP